MNSEQSTPQRHRGHRGCTEKSHHNPFCAKARPQRKPERLFFASLRLALEHLGNLTMAPDITFYDNYEAALPAGSYRIVLQQTVSLEGDPARHYYRDQKFAILAPR